MRVATAMLPDANSSQDRIFTTPNAVIVLDGASAFVPVEVSPSTYVDTLGRLLVEGLAADPRAPLTDLLARAIERSASILSLRPGGSPSSTVAIARVAGAEVDLLVLGDTQIATPVGVFVDDRIATLASAERATYRQRLAEGRGYDETHRALLRELQGKQAGRRNHNGGYWIAEASPAAARRAITVSLPITSARWLVLATDGAYRTMRHLQADDWGAVARRSAAALGTLLGELHCWEARVDPDGRELPRAKRHDDKALVSVVLDHTWIEPP